MTDKPVAPIIKYDGVAIKEMTNEQLMEASRRVIHLSTYRNQQLNNQRERHKKLDLENENPAYVELVNAIDDELKLRKL